MLPPPQQSSQSQTPRRPPPQQPPSPQPPSLPQPSAPSSPTSTTPSAMTSPTAAPDSPLVILGRTFFDPETLGLLVLSNVVVVVFLTSIRSVLISALMVGIGIIYAHAAFRAPNDLFLDEPESAPAFGFLSFFSGPASNASAVAARVLISTELKLSFSEKKREH